MKDSGSIFDGESIMIDVVDEIISKYDDLFLEDRFTEADEMLQAEDVGSMDTLEVVATLSATRCAKDKLPSRAVFVERSEKRLRELALDRVDKLMSGLY